MRHACPPPTSSDQPGPSPQAAERSQRVYVLVYVWRGLQNTGPVEDWGHLKGSGQDVLGVAGCSWSRGREIM